MIRSSYFAATAICLAVAVPPLAQAVDAVPGYISAAVADSNRPDTDRQRDADRKPAESVAFAGLQPGDKVADFFPGGGYFTRIFAGVVGPSGHVYAWVPSEVAAAMPNAAAGANELAAAYDNVSVLTQPAAEFDPPEALDLVWTAQNYHDLHNDFMGPADTVAFNRGVFDALKPGGIFLVLDHDAVRGSGFTRTQDLHRADMEAVRAEVEVAGFVFDGDSDLLRNADDDRTLGVREAEVRGHTDQFIMRFRKPE